MSVPPKKTQDSKAKFRLSREVSTRTWYEGNVPSAFLYISQNAFKSIVEKKNSLEIARSVKDKFENNCKIILKGLK